MQFTFLGTRYEANSFPIPVFDNQICDKYRGQARTNKNPQKALISQPFPNLKYRGVKYLSLVYSRRKNHSIKFVTEPIDSKNYPPQTSPEMESNEGAMEKITSDIHSVVNH